MTPRNSRFTLAAALAAIVLVLWSLVAPWAAAFPDRPDHYKVTLFGVRHVSDMTAESTQTSCGWGAADAECRPAPSGRVSYVALSSARWLMLGALALFLTAATHGVRSRRIPGGAVLWIISLVATAGAVLLVRSNVVSALGVFSEARAVVDGSGLNAALAAAGCAAVAAAHSLWVGRPMSS